MVVRRKGGREGVKPMRARSESEMRKSRGKEDMIIRVTPAYDIGGRGNMLDRGVIKGRAGQRRAVLAPDRPLESAQCPLGPLKIIIDSIHACVHDRIRVEGQGDYPSGQARTGLDLTIFHARTESRCPSSMLVHTGTG